jgi:3-hydroxybutyryl-CoA dehydratase
MTSSKTRVACPDDLQHLVVWLNKHRYAPHGASLAALGEFAIPVLQTVDCVERSPTFIVGEYEGTIWGFAGILDSTLHPGTSNLICYCDTGSPHGIPTILVNAAIKHAFDTLGVGRLEAGVLEPERDTLSVYLRLGFEIEGRSRAWKLKDGAPADLVRLGLARSEWHKHVKPYLESSQAMAETEFGKVVQRDYFLGTAHVEAFAQATGDRNPIHFDLSAAKATGLDAPIVHGMLSASLFSPIFAQEYPGPGSVYVSQEVRFVRPIPVESLVTATITTLAQIGRRYTLLTELWNGDVLVSTGIAVVLAPKSLP